jgi:hypothetical protein
MWIRIQILTGSETGTAKQQRAMCNVAIDSAVGCCYRDRSAWNTFPGSEYRKIIL